MLQKLKDYMVKLNEEGIAIPLFRDPVKDRGCISTSMFIISFTAAIILLAGKASTYFGSIDYNNVLWLLGLTGSFYFGEVFNKKLNIDGKKVDITDEK